jgi:DNA-binding GntR family transcriptional regulator
VHHAPGLAGLVESNAGMLVVASLFLAATDGPVAPGGGAAVPISISELSRRFGVGRAQVRRLLAGAAEAGLVRRAGGSDTVIVLPRLVSEVGGLFAALFALLAHCSEAAVEEVGGAPPAGMTHGAELPRGLAGR